MASITAALTRAATRSIGPPPKRSATRPIGVDATDVVTHATATAAPRAALSSPRSWVSWTAWLPRRNVGKTPAAVANVVAIITRAADGRVGAAWAGPYRSPR